MTGCGLRRVLDNCREILYTVNCSNLNGSVVAVFFDRPALPPYDLRAGRFLFAFFLSHSLTTSDFRHIDGIE
jgi:hypothetical protein